MNNKTIKRMFVLFFFVSPIYILLLQPPLPFPSFGFSYAIIFLLPYLSVSMPNIIGLFFIVFSFLISYVFSCGIVSVWDTIIDQLGEKGKRYERVIAFLLISVYVLIALILPFIGTYFGDYFISLENDTIQTISMSELSPTINPKPCPYGTSTASGTCVYKDKVLLQTLRLKNSFILPIIYKLPDITLCFYDSERRSTRDYGVVYTDKAGYWISYRLEPNKEVHNLFAISSRSEATVYLNAINAFGEADIWKQRDIPRNELERYDEFLLFRNFGLNNNAFCKILNETAIDGAEKIKIIK